MYTTTYVRIEETYVLNNKTIISRLSFSNNIKKYFNSSLFFAKYDVDIQDVDLSILNIPVVANIIPIAWAIGADIFVKELDQVFLQSLDYIKSIMKKWYPNFSFSIRMFVTKKIVNNLSHERNAMLFSGGLDSTCSYVECKNKKPILIVIWGADIPLGQKKFWEKVKKKNMQFAEAENAEIKFVKSNIRGLLNETNITRKFGKFCMDQSWWGAVQHGFSSLGLCAPLTVTEHIGNIFIASSWNPVLLKSGKPWGSHPVTDNKMSWANTKVIHHGDTLSRQEKIRYVLKEHIKVQQHYPTIRVCYSQFEELNCGKCEKCLRTITGLLLENIDPNKCGFNVTDDFCAFLKKSLLKTGSNPLLCDTYGMWKDIQHHIPERISSNLHGSKDFFEWFRCIELSERFDKRNPHYLFSLMLNKLPVRLRIMIFKLRNFKTLVKQK
ncbi:MAG: hypothetical protein NUK63_06090 [Candidatus Bathyarchaeum tardum]|nr:MAG: hypothetical protein NUK63_06090 [Candidatus Bathyarchaeum tardum]